MMGEAQGLSEVATWSQPLDLAWTWCAPDVSDCSCLARCTLGAGWPVEGPQAPLSNPGLENLGWGLSHPSSEPPSLSQRLGQRLLRPWSSIVMGNCKLTSVDSAGLGHRPQGGPARKDARAGGTEAETQSLGRRCRGWESFLD